MTEELVIVRSDRFVNKTVLELQQANDGPIEGYEDEELMTLENAVKKIASSVRNIGKYVNDAKQRCNVNSNILTLDQSAAIYLYTMSTPFFSRLNETLRAEDRSALKPWFPFLKLFMSALQNLPSSTTIVWRAVSTDIGSSIVKDDVKTWWSVNSSSTDLKVVEHYLGERGTLFAINAIDGKKIHEYSAYPDEKEVILMPGTRVRMTSESLNFQNLLQIVHLEEEFDMMQITQE